MLYMKVTPEAFNSNKNSLERRHRKEMKYLLTFMNPKHFIMRIYLLGEG